MRYLLVVLLLAFFRYAYPQGRDCKPELLLNGYKSGDTLAKANLSKITSLSIFYPCTKTVSNQIISYEFTISQAGHPESLLGFTRTLTSKMVTKTNELSSGSKIFIDNVLVKKADGSLGHIPGMTLIVGGQKGSKPLELDTPGIKIPDCKPVALAGKYKNGISISKSQLNLIKQISAYNTCNTGKKLNGCSTDIIYKVVSYQASAVINGKTWIFEVSSDEFPSEIRDQFRNMTSPAQLLISNIKAKYRDGCLVELPDVTLNITPVADKPADPGTNNFTRSPKKK